MRAAGQSLVSDPASKEASRQSVVGHASDVSEPA